MRVDSGRLNTLPVETEISQHSSQYEEAECQKTIIPAPVTYDTEAPRDAHSNDCCQNHANCHRLRLATQFALIFDACVARAHHRIERLVEGCVDPRKS